MCSIKTDGLSHSLWFVLRLKIEGVWEVFPKSWLGDRGYCKTVYGFKSFCVFISFLITSFWITWGPVLYPSPLVISMFSCCWSRVFTRKTIMVCYSNCINRNNNVSVVCIPFIICIKNNYKIIRTQHFIIIIH